MKRTLIIFIFSFFSITVYCQVNSSDTTILVSNNNKVNNFIGFIPSKAKTTNGWAIGWTPALEANPWRLDTVNINGLYTNISPFQVVVIAMAIPHLLKPSNYKKLPKDTIEYDNVRFRNRLNGLSVGLFDIGEEFCMQGVQLTLLYHEMGKLNGLSLTLLASNYKHFNGLMISGILNKTKSGKGLQIGLINKAKKLKGIQIGIWNKIGDKGFPLINMNLRN